MICPKCDSEVRDDAVFCTNCGARFETETVATGPEPPCVSAIPEPPQMPDLPAPPTMPTAQTSDAQLPPTMPTAQTSDVQLPPLPDTNVQQPYPYTPPPQTPPPFPEPLPQQGQDYQPPSQYPPTTGYPPQPGYMPQQGYQPAPGYQQQQPVYPPPAYPMPDGQRKSKTGLIIGIVAGVVVLMAAIVVFGLYIGGVIGSGASARVIDQITSDIDRPSLVVPTPPATPELPATPAPAPSPDPPPSPVAPQLSDERLLGEWWLEGGVELYFFGESNFIEFTEHGNGTFGVYEAEYGERGLWHIDSNGNLIIEGEWTGHHRFTYTISGDDLTLTDIDGDSAHYTRMG